MRFDLHCHTKEGSIDSKVSVREFADKYMTLGYDGFMISDHNSYKGCKAWDQIKDEPQYQNFTVIRGIEYDTKDAGHVLVILPDDVYLPLLRIRGLKLQKLIKIVHAYDGILGFAHPFGVSTSSAMGFKNLDTSLIGELDFIETFNTCESIHSNELAKELASKHNLPEFAGSDSHVDEYIGMASTFIDSHITCNNDFIQAVKDRVAIEAIGLERKETKKAKMKNHWLGLFGYMIYNRGIGKIAFPYRHYHYIKLKSV